MAHFKKYSFAKNVINEHKLTNPIGGCITF